MQARAARVEWRTRPDEAEYDDEERGRHDLTGPTKKEIQQQAPRSIRHVFLGSNLGAACLASLGRKHGGALVGRVG